MKAAFLSLALIAGPVIPASDRVPQSNVDALCKPTTDADKTMGLSNPQRLADFMRDEKDD